MSHHDDVIATLRTCPWLIHIESINTEVNSVNASNGSKFMVRGRSMPQAIIISRGITHRQICVDEPTAMPVWERIGGRWKVN